MPTYGLIHQRIIHERKAVILYPTVHFVSSRTQTNSAREWLARYACSFANSSFVASLLALAGAIPKKITFISPRVITLLVGLVEKKTTCFQNFLLVLDDWTSVKFEHCSSPPKMPIELNGIVLHAS